jgi:hypothetical protein
MIKVGEYTLEVVHFAGENPPPSELYIEYISGEGGSFNLEGGSFNLEAFEKVVAKFYDDNL